jgi:hypothetical protein
MKVNSNRPGITAISLIFQFGRVAILLSLFSAVGCGDRGGVVATEDQMKAHVEKYGDLSLDPAASTEIKD